MMSKKLDALLFARHLDKDEVVSKVIHKHWRLGLRELFWPTSSFILSWVVLYFVPFRTVFYIVALWSVASLVWWLRNFLDYYLDAWIITNMGIIDVEWHGWFYRESTRVLYSDIQGVSYEIKGVMNTFTRTGTVSVEKISTGNVFHLENVTNPRAVESLILRNMEMYIHSKNLKDATHVQELLSQLITQEVQLKEMKNRSDDTSNS
jgi:hypothetical protein